jgi:hypothetical protein
MKELAEGPNPPYFLEATIYSAERAVIQMGSYSDGPQDPALKGKAVPVNGINWWWKPFYYKWVETFLEKGEGEELIPLQHYYHRFTRFVSSSSSPPLTCPQEHLLGVGRYDPLLQPPALSHLLGLDGCS